MKKKLGHGSAKIPEERQKFVIQLIGQSFKDYFHALRQYIDNAKDSIIKRKRYDKSFKEGDEKIIILLDRDTKEIRIIDFGLGITPKEPILKTPNNQKISLNGVIIPYINSFENMAKNLLNSMKRFEDYQSGENASGMLAFIKLGCNNEEFIVKNREDGKIYTYIFNNDGEYNIFEGGDKFFGEEKGTEILLKGINKKIFDNWFNEHRLISYLRRTYHLDLLRGDIKINVCYSAKKSLGRGRNKKAPFIEIKPLDITGEIFEPTQIKTKQRHFIHIDLRISDTPRKDPFVLINCRGTGGVPAENILYNPIWTNDHLQGFINADFLNFSGNDKSSFSQDEKLEEFQEAIEEKIESKLAKKINEIKTKKASEKFQKILNNLKHALYRTLKQQHISLEGEVERTKKCPKCKTILPYNQQTCPECGFKFPQHMKKCKFCGEEIPSTAKECPKCGKKLINFINCPKCGKKIPELSFKCPECGEILRERKEPKGKSPDIYPQNLGEDGPRSAIDEENEKLIAVKINNVHQDYTKALNEGYELFYMSLLVAREVAKFKFGEGMPDYSEDMINIFLGIFNELKNVSSITYKEK